jgi:hypothetical protein
MNLASLFIGFYCGAGFMCTLTVGTSTVDGEKPGWGHRVFIALCWPYVALSLGDQ